MSRHIPISELVAHLFQRGDELRAVAMLNELQAYFDDSGTHSNSLVTAIGGYVGASRTWDAVQIKWSEILSDYERYGVSWFHAADIERRDGEWRSVPSNARLDAPMRFAACLGKHKLIPVWAAVVNEDFYRYATPEYLARFPDPFQLCFHEAMGQTYHWAKETGAPRVVPMAAHGDYAANLLRAHERYRADGDFSNYVGPIAFDSPRLVTPLQTADLVAHAYYNWWRETEYPSTPYAWKPSPVLDAATKRKPGLGACYSGNGMKRAVERFMDRLSGSP